MMPDLALAAGKIIIVSHRITFGEKSMFVFTICTCGLAVKAPFADRPANPPANLPWPWNKCNILNEVNHLEMNHFHLHMSYVHLEMNHFHLHMSYVHLDMNHFHLHMSYVHLEMSHFPHPSAGVISKEMTEKETREILTCLGRKQVL